MHVKYANSKKVIKCVFIHNMFNNLHVPLALYALCMHNAWLLYTFHLNNGDIEMGQDSSPTV